MKKLLTLLVISIILFSTSQAMARTCYVSAKVVCGFKGAIGYSAQFLIKGTVSSNKKGYLSEHCTTSVPALRLAIRAFIKAELAVKVEKFCTNTIPWNFYPVFAYKNKAKMNEHFSKDVDYCQNYEFAKKCIQVKGFKADEWDDYWTD